MKYSYTGLLVASFFVLATVFSASCKKEQLLSAGGELRFSADTLTFDTVFTAAGSFTLGVKIYNPQSQKINISSVRLGKGSSSYFHLNVNGFPGNSITDIEVAANDSIYVYATVNIDPNNDNTPFVVEDRLIATLNGRDFSIPFIAFGQNAHYIVDSVLSTDTWLTDKPYVIIRSALVDAGQTLTIPAGCRIYMNADSRLYVLGTLKAIGTKTDSIIFQGSRLDRKYFGNEGYPGEWGGIYIDTGSTGNELDWVILKNCGNAPGGGFPAALWVSGVGSPTPQLRMEHTIIENAIGYGVLCFNASIDMENCLVHSTGAQAFAVFQGGNYSVRNCDFINYYPSKLTHIDNPTAALLNYYKVSDNNYLLAPLTATMTNCLIYGSLEDELVCDKIDHAQAPVSIDFKNCLLRTKSTDAVPSWVVKDNCKLNEDPRFSDHAKWNFRAKDGSSPLVDAGDNSVNPDTDLDDRNRKNGIIDIGCYEFQ